MILRRPEKRKRRVRVSNSRKDLRRARLPESRAGNRRFLLVLALLCLGGLGSWALWLWWPTIVISTDNWFKEHDGLLVKEIVVEGNYRSSREEIIKALGLAPRQLIFTFNLKTVQARVNGLAFVKETRIRRSWPDRLEIKIKERLPKALLYLDQLYLVDQEGKVIAPAANNEKLDFPLISGVSLAQWQNQPEVWQQMLEKALDLILIWQNKGRQWSEKIAQIGLNEVCGLTVFTSPEIWEIELGADYFDERLNRWRQVLDELGEKSKGVKYFDCAGDDSVVVGIKKNLGGVNQKAEKHGQK